MRVNGIEKITRAGLAIALAGGLTAYGPSASAETGVTDSTIKIGAWGPLTGPLALLGQSVRDGLRVCFREVNEAGGVHGRKFDLTVYDDAGSPQEAQAAIRRLIGQDEVFMLLGGSASGSTLPVRHVIAREKVPFIASISSNINLMKPFSRYMFRIYANEVVMANCITDWMVTKEGVKRPAIIYNSNDYGVGGFQEFTQRLEVRRTR